MYRVQSTQNVFQKTIFPSASVHTSFLLLFQLWVPGNEFFPDCYTLRVALLRVFSLLFVSFFFAGSFATRIDPVRIPRFLSSWNSQESNFSGFVDNVKNNFWIFVRLANYGYHQLWAIKRKSYEGTLVELIESSGFRGWHEFNEDS